MTEMVQRLDDWGLPAWIAVMVFGFAVFWPAGLAILAYLIWSGRMGCSGRNRDFGNWQQRMSDRFERGMRAWGDGSQRATPGFARGFQRTGNHAFDEYREQTLRRLEDEANEFTSFLDRLRAAKDRSEFDQFMADRKARGASDTSSAAGGSVPPTGQAPQPGGPQPGV